MGFVIVTASGTTGDVLPFVAIGAELRKRGHEVTLVSDPVFERQAREAALSFVPVGTAAQYREFIDDPRLWDRDTVVSTVTKHALTTIEGFYTAVVRTHRRGETVLLTSGADGASIAQERLGIPTAACLIAPNDLSRLDPAHPSRPLPVWANAIARSRRGLRLIHGLRSRRQGILRALRGRSPISGSMASYLGELRRVRALAGLPETRVASSTVPELLIGLWPSWFSPPQKDWPQTMKISGFPFYPKPPARNAEPATAHDRSRPIVFTRGSAASRQQPFFAAAAECCRLLERPGLLVTPHAADVPSELPPTVSHVRSAPFGELFAGAAGVVHHGGIGTIAYALAAGIPQIVVPLVGHQFDLGYRMERLGVGSMLTQTPLSAARLARELDSLWRSERTRRRCEYFRSTVDPEAGCSLAADWIEQLIAAGQTRVEGRA